MEEQPDAADLDDSLDVEEVADVAPDVASDDASGPAAPAAAENRNEPPAPERTGVPSVDAALERLGDVANAPLDEHVEIYDDVQRQLHDALAELDDEQ